MGMEKKKKIVAMTMTIQKRNERIKKHGKTGVIDEEEKGDRAYITTDLHFKLRELPS